MKERPRNKSDGAVSDKVFSKRHGRFKKKGIYRKPKPARNQFLMGCDLLCW